MGLFGKQGGSLFGGGIKDGPLKHIGGLFDDGPNLVEKIDMLFTDVETEGKKQGYDRASKEYSIAFSKIENEFNETKKFIENQKNSYGNHVYKLVERLEELERQKADLERQVNSKVNDVSKKYNIPIDQIRGSMETGTLLVGGPIASIDILGMIYKYKEKKLREAEQNGYAKAKKVFDTKIQKLKDTLKRLKEKGYGEIKSLLNRIIEILDAIAEEEMKIAELKILLHDRV